MMDRPADLPDLFIPGTREFIVLDAQNGQADRVAPIKAFDMGFDESRRDVRQSSQPAGCRLPDTGNPAGLEILFEAGFVTVVLKFR